MHVLLIHNPGAGGAGHDRGALVRALTLAGHEVECRSTAEPDWIEALTAAETDLFAVAGGDGTANKATRSRRGGRGTSSRPSGAA